MLPKSPEWAATFPHFMEPGKRLIAASNRWKSSRFSTKPPPTLCQPFLFHSEIHSSTAFNRKSESVRMHNRGIEWVVASKIAWMAACISAALLVARPDTGIAQFLWNKIIYWIFSGKWWIYVRHNVALFTWKIIILTVDYPVQNKLQIQLWNSIAHYSNKSHQCKRCNNHRRRIGNDFCPETTFRFLLNFHLLLLQNMNCDWFKHNTTRLETARTVWIFRWYFMCCEIVRILLRWRMCGFGDM